MVVIGCEPEIESKPESEPDPSTTKFEGTWVKEDRKFIFTGDVCVSQSISNGSFRNSRKWSVKFNDIHIRLIMESHWGDDDWIEWPLDYRLEVLVFTYTLNGNQLHLTTTDTVGTSLNGEWTRQ